VAWRKEEIVEQLDDLGAYRREVEAERTQAEATLRKAEDAIRESVQSSLQMSATFADLERDIDARLARIFRSTAAWAYRAAQAGIPEREVLDRLDLGTGPTNPEDWEFADE